MAESCTYQTVAGHRRGTGTCRAGALLAGVAMLWIAPLMIGHEPWLDEGYGFSLIYNILLTGDSVVPTMGGLPFMEKPPLYYILGAWSAQGLHPWLALHDGARLINLPLTACCLIALAVAARRLYDGEQWLYAPLLFLASLGTWDAFHRIITDVALLAGFTVAVAGLVWADRRPLAGGFWLGFGAGVAFMSKGLLGPGMIGAGTLLLPALSARYRNRAFAQTLAVAALAASPWVLIWPARLYLHSPELFHIWFWDNNFGRFLGSGLGPREQFGFYLTTLLWQAWPALPLAAWAALQRYRQLPASAGATAATLAALALTGLAFALQAGKVYALPLIAWLLWLCRRADDRSAGGPWIAVVACFASTLLILSSAGTSTEIYAMPLLVPLALLGPAALASFPARAAKWLDHLGIGVAGLAVAALWLGWLTTLLRWPAWLSDPLLARAPDFSPAFAPAAVAVAALATTGWLVCLHRVAPTPRGWVSRWLAGIISAGFLLDALYASAIDSTLTYRHVFQSLQQALPARFDCISSRQVGESFRGMLQYRTGVALIDTEHSGSGALADCELRLLREGHLELAPARNWELLWQGGRSGDYRVFHLYRRRDPAAPAPPGDPPASTSSHPSRGAPAVP